MTTPDDYLSERLDRFRHKQEEWLAAEKAALAEPGDGAAKQRAVDLWHEYMIMIVGDDFPPTAGWYVSP